MIRSKISNIEIRQLIAKNRLRHYEVASACGISEYTFSHWLNRELTPERETQIREAINSLTVPECVGRRGMKIPVSCRECDFWVNLNGCGNECFFENVGNYYGFEGEWPSNGRHEQCPLVEVSP